jgi:NitT/TauT family transport system substrate-binding protein
MMIKRLLLGLATVGLTCGALLASVQAEETMRLEWVIQGQFAGPVVASDRGYYKEAGIDLKLLPAGPDIKPAVTVAQGTDTFGIGHPNQVISARSNGVPMVMVMQFGQKSATTYIARKDTGITKVQDMPGHSVGLWFGGDEHEFLAMLDAAGVAQDDVSIISQGFDIIGWLNKDYEVMQVTLFNELLQVYDQGYKKSDLVFLDPSDYGVALVSGGIFTTEKVINENPEALFSQPIMSKP